jgi:hypothetical protein
MVYFLALCHLLEFGNTMKVFVDFFGKISDELLKAEGTHEVSDINSVLELVSSKKNIVFLTGAGISVESGMPTFRGDGGLWTLKD